MAISPKRTYFHITIQNYDNVNHHFLIPQRTDNYDVTAGPINRSTLTHRTQYHVTKSFHLADDQKSPDPERSLNSSHPEDDDNTLLRADFSAAMKPSGYGEAVSVIQGPPSLDQSVLTVCDYKATHHYKESVDIGPALCPVWHRSRIVCHSTTTKKNFRTSVHYQPRIKPLRYESTQYVRPRHLATTYVSCVDYTSHDDDRRYVTSVYLTPVTAHHNAVHGFRLRLPADVIDKGVIAADADHVNADVNMNIVKDDVIIERRARQPPLLWSSGPAEEGDVTMGEEGTTHRTKMVVKSTAAQHVTGDAYTAYLNGYWSDVNANGYPTTVADHQVDNDVTDF